jgi:23S rRNA (cytosine1962-C5)-methyltransferase
VDAFADVAVIHAESSMVLDEWLPDLREALSPRWATAYAKVHPRGPRPAAIAMDAPTWGPPREELEVVEYDSRYLVRPSGGLSVGLFLDMREVRQWLRQHARGKAVLNLFAYTCSLGVSAASGEAERVVNVDVSRPYLEWGKASASVPPRPRLSRAAELSWWRPTTPPRRMTASTRGWPTGWRTPIDVDGCCAAGVNPRRTSPWPRANARI